MPEAGRVNLEAIGRRLGEHRLRVEGYHAGLARLKNGLVASGLGGSSLATLVAGVTAAHGPVVGSGPPGWRLSCIVAATLSVVAGVSVGLKEQLQVTERSARALECLGRLGALEAALATGLRNETEIAAEYESVLKDYPDLLR